MSRALHQLRHRADHRERFQPLGYGFDESLQLRVQRRRVTHRSRCRRNSRCVASDQVGRACSQSGRPRRPSQVGADSARTVTPRRQSTLLADHCAVFERHHRPARTTMPRPCRQTRVLLRDRYLCGLVFRARSERVQTRGAVVAKKPLRVGRRVHSMTGQRQCSPLRKEMTSGKARGS